MTEFDETSRAHIRQALKDYMRSHRVGVPTLAIRIRENTLRKPKISGKTLERFLKNKGRSYDMHVGFYEAFLSRPNVRDATSELGRTLHSFFSGETECDYTGTFVERSLKFVMTTMEIRPGQGFWHVSMSDKKEGHRLLNGVLVDADSTAFVVLKDSLTGLPVSCSLRMQEDRLTGSYIGPEFLDVDVAGEPLPSPFITGEIALTREGGNGA